MTAGVRRTARGLSQFSRRENGTVPLAAAPTIRAALAAALLLLAGPATTSAQQPDSPPGMTQHEVELMVGQMQVGLHYGRQALDGLEARMPKLADDIQQLLDQLREIPPPQPPEQKEPPKDEPKKVKYRPPREKIVDKKALNFIVENGRVSFIDYDAVKKKMKDIPKTRKNVAFDLDDSDFRIEGTQSSDKLELTVIRKENHPGETWEEIQKADSRFQSLVAARDKKKAFVKFHVWPDSFDTYRKARGFTWKLGYGVGWSPMKAGGKMKLIRGLGVGTET